MVTEAPSRVLSEVFFSIWAALSAPATTWYSSTLASSFLLCASVLSVALGTFAKAALVGANTVSFDGPDRALTRPADLTSLTSVDSCGLDAARATMFGSLIFALRWAVADATGTAASAQQATSAARIRFISDGSFELGSSGVTSAARR